MIVTQSTSVPTDRQRIDDYRIKREIHAIDVVNGLSPFDQSIPPIRNKRLFVALVRKLNPFRSKS